MKTERMLTPAQLVEICPALTARSLKWMLFKARENGLANFNAVIHIGRKVLIDEEAFLAWLRSRALGTNSGQPSPNRRDRRRPSAALKLLNTNRS